MTVRTKIPTQNTAPQPSVSAGELELATPMPRSAPQPVMVHQPEVKSYPPKIAKAILAITREIDPVAKAGMNTFHKYKYAKWEDILDVLSPLIAKHGLIIQQSEYAHGGFAGDLIEISYEFTIINEDGDVWPDRPQITAICKVRDQKGVLDDKAASKCFTQAQKYMMVGLFKIRTADIAEADHDAAGPKQETRKRPAPSPSGKIAPHTVDSVPGDSATTWTERFLLLLAKAQSQDELNEWDRLNGNTIDRVKERDTALYNRIVDALTFKEPVSKDEARQEARQESTQQQARTAPSPSNSNADGLDIPPALDRRKQRNGNGDLPKPELTPDERDWLLNLGGAFSGEESMDGLQDQQDRLMTPYKDKVSEFAWNKATDLLTEHVERLQGE